MIHEPAPTVRVDAARWVVECACGHVAEGSHPVTAEGRHDAHVRIEAARAALKGET